MYKATLFVEGNPKTLNESFKTELSREKGSNARAKTTIKRQSDGVVFTVDAKDSVALRAQLLGLTKLLTVIEEADRLSKL